MPRGGGGGRGFGGRGGMGRMSRFGGGRRDDDDRRDEIIGFPVWDYDDLHKKRRKHRHKKRGY